MSVGMLEFSELKICVVSKGIQRGGSKVRVVPTMQVKVVLPTGEVNVPVEPNSTPGHLKENLKYSIRVPPKQIKLTCEGRELDDIKPLTGEPNNVQDGAVLVAERREGVVEEDMSTKASPPPTMIKKEEPPKPKKPKKDVVRPTLVEGDVKKEKTLQPGHQGWAAKAAYLEAKSKKRHLVYLKIEAIEEKKAYPEHEDFQVVLALGDPQCSPVWTAVVQLLEIGEKARFTLSRKVLDFNPESLAPDDYCSTWEVELLRVLEVEDVMEDFQQLLEIESSGGKERAEDLDNVAVHWRVRRWMPEGTFCIASSRERIAIMPGYGLVPIEDQNAPPVSISVGEGQQEAVEVIASRVGPGGQGHLYLKSQAMKSNRPAGCVIMDVEVVAMDPCRGPGTPGCLDKALLGRSSMITCGFERVKEICFQHASSFHHALDVGCACGALSFALSERFQRVVGLDTSLSFVQACGTLQRRRAVPYVLPGQQVRCAASISSSVRPERCSFACMDATEFLQTGECPLRFDPRLQRALPFAAAAPVVVPAARQLGTRGSGGACDTLRLARSLDSTRGVGSSIGNAAGEAMCAHGNSTSTWATTEDTHWSNQSQNRHFHGQRRQAAQLAHAMTTGAWDEVDAEQTRRPGTAAPLGPPGGGVSQGAEVRRPSTTGQLGRHSGRYSAQKHGWQHPLGQIEAKTQADSDQEIGSYAWSWRVKDRGIHMAKPSFLKIVPGCETRAVFHNNAFPPSAHVTYQTHDMRGIPVNKTLKGQVRHQTLLGPQSHPNGPLGGDAGGWKGWQNLINEREVGDQWLDEADGRRKQLETFGTLRKSTEE
eukprot:s1303_g19.t2